MNMATQRAKNVDAALQVVEAIKWGTIPAACAEIALETGVREDTAQEYLKLLAKCKRIRILNGYVVSLSYKGPEPGTEAFERKQAEDARMAQEKAGKTEELNDEEKAVLGE